MSEYSHCKTDYDSCGYSLDKSTEFKCMKEVCSILARRKRNEEREEKKEVKKERKRERKKGKKGKNRDEYQACTWWLSVK